MAIPKLYQLIRKHGPIQVMLNSRSKPKDSHWPISAAASLASEPEVISTVVITEPGFDAGHNPGRGMNAAVTQAVSNLVDHWMTQKKPKETPDGKASD